MPKSKIKPKVVRHKAKLPGTKKRQPAPFIRTKLRGGSVKKSTYDEVAAFGRALAMRKTAGAVRSALGRMLVGGGIGTGAEYLLGDTGLPPLTLAGVGALGGLAAPLVWKGRAAGRPNVSSKPQPVAAAAADKTTSAWASKRDAVIEKFRKAFQMDRMSAQETWKQYGDQLQRQYGITAAELGL